MLKLRLPAVAAIAAVGLTSVAFAQAGTNQYTIDGKVAAHGGSKKKPKPSTFGYGFTIKAPDGSIPEVVESFDITIEGTRVNTSVVPTCAGEAMDRAQSDSVCPKGSLIGTGTIGDAVGISGKPFASAVYCDLPVKVHNSGNGKAAIWIKAGPPNCLAAVAQAIPATWTNTAKGASLRFSVPEELRHQLGLVLAVTSVRTTFPKRTKRIKGKTVGYYESIGCKDGKRDITAKFTDEEGASKTIAKTLGRC